MAIHLEAQNVYPDDARLNGAFPGLLKARANELMAANELICS